MRAVVTGQVGVDKAPYIQAVQRLATARGIDLKVCNVGAMMYAEAPDVPAGRILNLPITRLNTLRRSVFKEILNTAQQHEHLLVNTHATFRWHHGLFAAFDFDQIQQLNPDLYVTVLDNVENVHARLVRDHELEHTLKDIMVWREEELLATEILANSTRGYGHFYMLSRGRNNGSAASLERLMFQPGMKKAYLSFPMTHVVDQPAALTEIEAFKLAMRDQFICFDPADVDEFLLHSRGQQAVKEGIESFDYAAEPGTVSIATREVVEIGRDIMGQTYARDFKMVDQSDMIVSIIPELSGGKPALSSGVERELQHAYEGGKEVYVVWRCKTAASPFITQTATAIFPTVDDALAHFRQKGYIAANAPTRAAAATPSASPAVAILTAPAKPAARRKPPTSLFEP
jgi:adenylate kinase